MLMTALSPSPSVFRPGEAHRVSELVRNYLRAGIDFIVVSRERSLPCLVRREKAALVYGDTDEKSLAWTRHGTVLKAIADWASTEFSRGASELRIEPVPGP